MTRTRLSALDASFLAAETPTAHMHVGWAAVFDPPDDGDRPTFAELREHIAARLDRAPRYRQRLAMVPFGVHDPEWVDDDEFVVSRHVLETPATDIDTIVASVMSTPLERSRPLWECWVCPRLDDGRIGVVGKVHHSMVDGLAAVELAALLLDDEPAAPTPPPSKWRPESAPSGLELLARGALDRGRAELALARAPVSLISSPRRAVDAARRVGASLAGSFMHPAQPTPALNPDLSPLRHVARLARPLDDLVRVKDRFDATVNDVVLAVSAGAVRRFLEHHGEDAASVKAMVPVTMRSADEADGLGNRISFLFVELPCHEPDPVQRLRLVQRTMGERKRSGEARGGDLVLSALSHAPHVVQRAMTRVVASPRTFNLVVSNIPGLREPMWMRGCRLREAYPVVPLADRHAVAIGVTTVEDQAFFGLYADRKMMPDAAALAAAIDIAVDELLVAGGMAPGPSDNGHSRRVPVLT